MSRIFWDTNLYVYLLEDKGELAERVVSLRERMIERLSRRVVPGIHFIQSLALAAL